MNMRRQFIATLESILATDPTTVLLLGDIGVFGFKKASAMYPDRVYNIGILEPSTIGVAAGLALTGYVPVVHTIAPFLVERALEQLKIDFGYQRLGGNFISVGGSYDYAALGCTHHCPGDVGILLNIPGMEIVLPGTSEEFDQLFHQAYSNGRPTYFRLSEQQNSAAREVAFGRASLIQEGRRATVLAVGPMLDAALEAARGQDVAVVYCTTLAPFDASTLREACPSRRVILCEPYYSGALIPAVQEALAPEPVRILTVGVPRTFLREYGRVQEHDSQLGINADGIRMRIQEMIAQ